MIREKFNVGPHIGILKVNLYIHRMLDDGSVDPEIVDCTEEFQNLKMTNKGEIHVVGYDKKDCIEKVKNMLESLGKTNVKKRK
jgi:hypothetical protein